MNWLDKLSILLIGGAFALAFTWIGVATVVEELREPKGDREWSLLGGGFCVVLLGAGVALLTAGGVIAA